MVKEEEGGNMAFETGQIIAYLEMCMAEGTQLQRGMNFKLKSGKNVILMSRRANAPYTDSISPDGKIIIYEGHDVTTADAPIPKMVDQPFANSKGVLTQNGHFFQAAKSVTENKSSPELVQVYEKLIKGTWVFNGIFNLLDAYEENDGNRKVFKFKLELTDVEPTSTSQSFQNVSRAHKRVIPSEVKREVFKRDSGKCVLCGKTDNIHFDHILPYSKGGTSILADNIQILCAFHNLQKSNHIE